MIRFRCPNCEKLLQVSDESAGKKARCACETVTRVPSSAQAAPTQSAVNPEVVDPVAANPGNAAPMSSGFEDSDFDHLSPVPAGTAQGGFSPTSAVANPYAAQPSSPVAPVHDARGMEPDAMMEAAESQHQASQQGSSFTNKGTLSGIAMMVGAVIWFFVGLAAGVIFFYPPILFIFGFVGFVKGLTGGED